MRYVQNIQWVQNINFCDGKHVLPNSLLNPGNVRKLNISFIIWPALHKFSILFSAVKLKLWLNFSKFIYTFKIGLLNLGYRLYFRVFSSLQRDQELVFLNVTLAGILNFSQFMDGGDWKLRSWNISLDCTSKFFSIH